MEANGIEYTFHVSSRRSITYETSYSHDNGMIINRYRIDEQMIQFPDKWAQIIVQYSRFCRTTPNSNCHWMNVTHF